MLTFWEAAGHGSGDGAALRESEARLRRLVEQASDAFFVHDLGGRLVDTNRLACEGLG